MPRVIRTKGKNPLLVLLITPVIFWLPSCRREVTNEVSKVPIVLLSIDTLRADHLSCYGYNRETSPSVDRFAVESVLFENAISPSPVTTPAHISIFTATAPVVHGRKNISSSKRHYEPFPAGIISAAEVLKANGYITLGLHGGANVEGLCGLKRGFDYYAYVPPESLNSRLAEVIQSYRTSASPLFIFLHHYVCHDPYTRGPKDLRLRFAKGHEQELASIIDEVEALEAYGLRKRRFWQHFDIADPVDREQLTALYDGGIFCSDSLFAGTQEVLQREGLYDDALFIVLSDHGEEFFEHGGKLHSRLFIETLHVPLLIKFPHQEFAGRRVPGDIRTIDLFPTVFEYLGIKKWPPSFEGRSFLPLLLKRGTYNPLIMSFSPPGNRIRFHEQGFVFAHEPGLNEKKKIRYWVFDRKNDPGEQINLAEARPDLLRKMELRSQEIMRGQKQLSLLFRNSSRLREKIDEDVMEQLRALGYVR